MKKLLFALVYTALTAGANTALAADADIIAQLTTGDMKKLIVHSTPKATSSAAFFLEDDAGTATLADYEGKYILLNFWATWCAPCRKEMPHLSELKEQLGEDLEVVTIATGLNQRPAMERFFEEIGVDNLPLHTDNNSALARDFGVVGLPVTLILNPEGLEIARLIGDADWTSDSAYAILNALADDQ